MFFPALGPNIFRVTIFYRDTGSGLSWSESYWPIGMGSTDAAAQAIPALANARTQLNYPSIRLIAARVSDEAIQRDAYLLTPEDPNSGLIPSAPESDIGGAEMPYSTILVRFEATSLYHTQHYISGISDAAIQDPPGPVLGGNLGTFWNNYRNQLLGIGKGKLAGTKWGILAISKSAVDTVPANVVLATVEGLGYQITVQDVNVAVGDTVKIYNGQFTGPVPGDGYMRVTTVNIPANTVTVQCAPGVIPTWVGGGQLRRLRRTLQPITNVIIRGETHRKRGGRFFLPRGRALTRK